MVRSLADRTFQRRSGHRRGLLCAGRAHQRSHGRPGGAIGARLRPLAFEIEVAVRDVVSLRSGVRCAGGLKVCLSLSPRQWLRARWCRIVVLEPRGLNVAAGEGFSGRDSWRRGHCPDVPGDQPGGGGRGAAAPAGSSCEGETDPVLLILVRSLVELSNALRFLPTGEREAARVCGKCEVWKPERTHHCSRLHPRHPKKRCVISCFAYESLSDILSFAFHELDYWDDYIR